MRDFRTELLFAGLQKVNLTLTAEPRPEARARVAREAKGNLTLTAERAGWRAKAFSPSLKVNLTLLTAASRPLAPLCKIHFL